MDSSFFLFLVFFGVPSLENTKGRKLSSRKLTKEIEALTFQVLTTSTFGKMKGSSLNMNFFFKFCNSSFLPELPSGVRHTTKSAR